MRGIRILDMSRVLAGPWATMHLADQGAEVIKVEPPGGDDTRAFGPHERGVSTYFLAANRNKRSIVLDLGEPADREILYGLVPTVDVVVQNVRPGVAERLGCDEPTLRALRPDLVFVSLTAFGNEGPWADRPGYDLVLQALGGAMAITGQAGSPPTKCGTSIADLTTGLFVVQAILQGLLHRERTGEGDRIDVSMMMAQAHALAYHASRFLVAGTEDVQRGNSHAGLAPYDVYPCADGWLALGCGNDRIFRRLCAALELEARPEWSTNPGRVADRERLDAEVRAKLSGLSVAEADARLADAGVPAGPVLRPGEVVRHPAVDTVWVEHATLGPIEQLAPVFRTRTTREIHRAPPLPDGDRATILPEAGPHHGDPRS
ncbi:MAG: CoA transferase [Alphaproteobacteria bacterium]|nr:CoA transferase [Alphaproteobacteria bacterium]